MLSLIEDAPDRLEAGGQLLLEAVSGGPVVPAALESVGHVLLADDGVGEVVRVAVALAVPEPLGPGVRGHRAGERARPRPYRPVHRPATR